MSKTYELRIYYKGGCVWCKETDHPSFIPNVGDAIEVDWQPIQKEKWDYPTCWVVLKRAFYYTDDARQNQAVNLFCAPDPDRNMIR